MMGQVIFWLVVSTILFLPIIVDYHPDVVIKSEAHAIALYTIGIVWGVIVWVDFQLNQLTDRVILLVWFVSIGTIPLDGGTIFVAMMIRAAIVAILFVVLWIKERYTNLPPKG
jgi:hypothetical protein